MKTVATARRQPAAQEASKGGGSRKPFFAGPVSQRSGEETVQARLRLGRPGDRFEREADRVADRVVDGKPAGHLGATVTPLSQRMEDEEAQTQTEEEEEAAQAREEGEEEAQAQLDEQEEAQTQAEEEEEPAQAQAEDEEEPAQAQAEEEEAQTREEEEQAQARGGGGLTVSDEVTRQVRAARGGGNPLPGPVRDRMEQQFGADLSGVRIHTDSAAVQLSKALRAQAFTRGSDIFFNERRFDPSSRDGAHLLAHELTHTIQQGAVEPEDAETVRLAASDEQDTYEVRPEIVEAIRLARGEVGKVNARIHGADGKRVGWERLREYFNTALGGSVIHEKIIDKVTTIETDKGKKDALPSWCGIFTWWAMKKAGIPLPDWKLGAPALDAMKPRAAGELPRKGDIAIDVLPNNHFAMVTGLESAKDAEGKPAKLTRVATVNGNTAGEDNLGGQVQEKWDALARWDHFLDPVGKMSLPEVPLVTVGREPGEAEGPEAAEAGPPATAEAAPPPEAPGDRPDVEGLDQDVPAPAPDGPGAAFPEPDLSLPPPVEPGPAEKVAEVEKVDLSGTSDQAATSFMDDSPSAMAASQPDLGPTLDGKMKSEQQEIVNNPPVLAAKSSGAIDAPITAPGEIPVPSAEIGDATTGHDPGAIDTVTAPTPEAFRGNADRERDLEQEDTGSFWDAFKNFLRRFTSGIRTKDGSIDTSAGERPTVALEGDADAGRMETQRAEGAIQLKGQRDDQEQAFRNHPGQSNIQPKMIDEECPAAPSAEPNAEIPAQSDAAVRDYAEAPLPADVRAAGDAKISEKLTPNLAEARQQTAQAATTRDAGKQQEIDTAQAAAEKLNTETDAAQRDLVVRSREQVAAKQGEGIRGAYDIEGKAGKELTDEQTARRKAIGEHVKSEEGKAGEKLAGGEKEAQKEKEKGEKEAAEKKKQLEKEQEESSWWDRVKSAIKKAVKVITEAIDKVFTAVRKAVATIIEKAKNAAIGLINKARTWVVDKIDKFRDWAKDKVNKYLKDSFPGLARKINGAIDAVADTAIKGVNAVADAAIATVTALADGLAKALDKILSTFQTALKTAVRVVGAVLQGDFAEALRAAIEGACEIAGVDPKKVFEFLDRAGKQIMTILKDPVPFIKNLFGAVGQGLSNFLTNIKTHLIQGVIGWLTGALAEVNLAGPFEFTPKGILRIVLEILGLTYANIKARVIRKFPKAATVFDAVEEGLAFLKRLVTEGPAALWEEIKSQVGNLKDMVMGAIRNWLITTVIKEGVVWLLSLTNPASAIVKAIKLVYDLVMFLVERYQQIKDFVVSVYEAVSAIAAGQFGLVVKAVENALARIVPVLISLLASILGLGGIAKQVKNVIGMVTKPINKAIDKVVDKIVAFAKKILGKVKAGARKVKQKAKAVAQKILQWWKARSGFKDPEGRQHTLSYKGQKGAAKLYVASTNPTHIPTFLDGRLIQANGGKTRYTVAQVQQAQTYHTANVVPAENKLKAADTGSSTQKKIKDVNENKKLLEALQKHLDVLGRDYLRHMFGSDPKDFPPPRLPVMADNVKARSFSADYIVRENKYPYSVDRGTESGTHVGNLEGWSALKSAGLTVGSTYVRMHLLPHRLGGDAVDSNLTPASGPKFNVPFSSGVEQPAIDASTEGSEPKREPIWYKFSIDYHSGPPPAPAFPSLLQAEWGRYVRDPGKDTWSRGPRDPKGFKTASPPLPSFTPVAPDINDLDTTAGEIAAAADVDHGFAVLILNLRNDIGGSFGKSQGNFTRKMNDRYLDRPTGKTRRGIEDYNARLEKVKAAISSGKLLLK